MKTPGYVVEAHYPAEIHTNDGWLNIITDRLEYCRGFMAARRELAPRPAYRLRRLADGHIMESLPVDLQARMGMVAGWPTGRQQLVAAARVLSKVRPHGEYVTEAEAACATAALAVLEPNRPPPLLAGQREDIVAWLRNFADYGGPSFAVPEEAHAALQHAADEIQAGKESRAADGGPLYLLLGRRDVELLGAMLGNYAAWVSSADDVGVPAAPGDLSLAVVCLREQDRADARDLLARLAELG